MGLEDQSRCSEWPMEIEPNYENGHPEFTVSGLAERNLPESLDLSLRDRRRFEERFDRFKQIYQDSIKRSLSLGGDD